MGKGTAAALYDRLIAKARAEKLPRLTVLATIFSRSFLLRRSWQIDGEGMKDYDGLQYHLTDLSLALG
jgi:hypothetical protein